MAIEPNFCDDADTWGIWVDDDEDEVFDKVLVQSTQAAEEQERLDQEEQDRLDQEEQERQLQQYRNQSRRGVETGNGSTGPSMTPLLAAQVFNSRRESLQQRNVEKRPTPTPDSSYTCADTLAQIQYLNRQYAEEKDKNIQLMNQLFVAQGESGNLRRQVETLKNSLQEDQIARIVKEREEKQKYEDEKKELKRQITALRTDLRVAENNIVSLQSKNAMQSAGNRSIGGAQSSHQKLRTSFSQATSSSMLITPPPKPRSDPNLRTLVQERSFLPCRTTPLSTSALPIQPKVVVAEKGIKADVDILEQERRDEMLFSGTSGNEELNIGKVENVASLERVFVRREIFANIHKLIQLQFQNKIKTEITSIESRAPKEIMARFTRGVEMKNGFPDLVENMFLYGVQAQQKKEGVLVRKKYPKLHSNLNPPIIDLNSVYVTMESSFVHDSAWLALTEIKKQLKQLLSGVEGDSRFRLYEFSNLQALWTLLAWAKHLWKFITFEEEFDSIVKSHGQKVWIEELNAWTGLILKIDWRDFFVPELEKLVRGFSLSILETIVTAGYFDNSQRRYEILYCVLKDTLLQDHLRSEQFIKRCLNIITWSLTDNRNILNYLCVNNNSSNCLARILGESVLRCFKELKNPYKATTLFLFYCQLLISLMAVRPPNFFSKIVCPSTEKTCYDNETDESDSEEGEVEPAVDGDEMEVDMMASQFACPEKYKLVEGSSERAKKFNKVKAAKCWIDPKEWEVSMGKTSEPIRCQCRKVLLGSTFIMLYHIVKWWKASILKRDDEIEHRLGMEIEELQKMRVEWPDNLQGKEASKDEIIANLSKKLESIKQCVVAISNAEETDDDDADDDDADKVLEKTWDEFLSKLEPPEDVNPKKNGYAEKLIPTTIFDLAVRTGILLMSFYDSYSDNLALSAGSEAFNCFTLLVSETKVFERQPCVTFAEERFLMNIIRQDDTDRCGALNDSTTFSDDEDDEANNACVLLPEDDNVGVLCRDFPAVPLKKFSEIEFERAFECLQKENVFTIN